MARKIMGGIKNPVKIEPRLVLLNSEGPLLTLYRINHNAFGLSDRKKILIALLSKDDVLRFVDGEGDIVDSDGNSWHYPEHKSYGAHRGKIEEFLNRKYE